jgi:hypothetical protein
MATFMSIVRYRSTVYTRKRNSGVLNNGSLAILHVSGQINHNRAKLYDRLLIRDYNGSHRGVEQVLTEQFHVCSAHE